MGRTVLVGDPEYGELMSASGGAVIFTDRGGVVWRWYGDRFIEVDREPEVSSVPPRRKLPGWFRYYGPEVRERNG